MKYYIILEKSKTQKERVYLCSDTSFTTDKDFALGINNPNVAQLAMERINQTLTSPPYCSLVHE